MERRTFLAAMGAFGTCGLAPRSLASVALGNAALTTISDGALVLPASFVFDSVPEDGLSTLRKEFGVESDTLMPECNLALYRDGKSTVLFDVGSGPDFMPSAGKITQSMDALGVSAEDVTHVVFTHAHPDHIWGLLDDFDEPLFPNATYMMGRVEWDYWWNPATVDEIGEARAVFAVGAKRRMQAIEDAVVLFDDGDEVLPGISAIASFGHTPGHMSFEVRKGSDAALIVGDAIVNHHVAFARPQWPSGSDQDPQSAITTRLQLLDRLAEEQMRLVGFHLPAGGMGRVERADGSYRFIPEGA